MKLQLRWFKVRKLFTHKFESKTGSEKDNYFVYISLQKNDTWWKHIQTAKYTEMYRYIAAHFRIRYLNVTKVVSFLHDA